MKKIFTIKLKSFLFLIFLTSLTFVGCKKQATETIIVDKTQQVSIEEIQNWVGSFNLKISEQPILIYGLAQKANFKDNSYVRVPTYVDGNISGSFYFNKSVGRDLQVLYVVTKQMDSSKLDGNVAFVDFDHKSLTLLAIEIINLFLLTFKKMLKAFLISFL